MSLRSLLAIALVLAAVAPLAKTRGAGETGSRLRRAAYPAHFPDGPGKAIADRTCLTCHSAMLSTQQHKDSIAWDKTLKQMEAWGAKASSSERESLLVYLTQHFGPPAPK